MTEIINWLLFLGKDIKIKEIPDEVLADLKTSALIHSISSEPQILSFMDNYSIFKYHFIYYNESMIIIKARKISRAFLNIYYS